MGNKNDDGQLCPGPLVLWGEEFGYDRLGLSERLLSKVAPFLMATLALWLEAVERSSGATCGRWGVANCGEDPSGGRNGVKRKILRRLGGSNRDRDGRRAFLGLVGAWIGFVGRGNGRFNLA